MKKKQVFKKPGFKVCKNKIEMPFTVNFFTVSLLSAAVSAQKFATCVLRAETVAPLSITGRIMFRDYPGKGVYMTGFYNGFEIGSIHPVAVIDSAYDAFSCPLP